MPPVQSVRGAQVLPQPSSQEAARILRSLRQVHGGEQAGAQDQDGGEGAQPRVGGHLPGGAGGSLRPAGGQGVQPQPGEGRPAGPAQPGPQLPPPQHCTAHLCG